MRNLTRNNVVLLACLLTLIILAPLFERNKGLISDILLTAIFFSGIFSLDFSTKSLKILLPLGAITAASIWFGRIIDAHAIYLMENISTFLLLVAIVVLMIRHIARSQNITPTIILSSINGYLLLGVLTSVLLAIAHRLPVIMDAGASSGIQFPDTTTPNLGDFIYFGFVTLTTLGYGDIVPVSHLSRSLTVLIAIAGQMYVTILIAMLVGKFLSGPKG